MYHIQRHRKCGSWRLVPTWFYNVVFLHNVKDGAIGGSHKNLHNTTLDQQLLQLCHIPMPLTFTCLSKMIFG